MDITSIFLGPKSENNEAFRKFLNIIVEDVINFRNNYHPDEAPLISEQHKIKPSFLETQADFLSHLKEVLGQLRAHSIPTWDTSYIAHMHGDLLYPAIAGYISTIMYNPNNVTGESSPVTTKWEMDFISEMCNMIGYNPFSSNIPDQEEVNSWGHIASGGTVANIEGLWVARNLKYWPLSIKLAYLGNKKDYSFIGDFQLNNRTLNSKKIKECSFKELFNLSPDCVYSLINNLQLKYIEVRQNISTKHTKLSDEIAKYSLQELGIHGIHREVLKEEGAELKLPKVYISKTKHYSWEKCMEVLGLGTQQLEVISPTQSYKLDIKELKEKIIGDQELQPILAIIPIVGTTEEGIVDPIAELLEFRGQMEDKYATSFYIHADAAYGGYFSSVFVSEKEPPNQRLNTSEALQLLEEETTKGESIEGFVITEDDKAVLRSRLDMISQDLLALSEVDSITIDPHKLGYIPYPAGSILYKNMRAQEMITFQAPYLQWSGDNPSTNVDRIFLGKSTLEGSRPGAAATSCYLASKLVPLNISGYGKIMLYTMIAANRFFHAIPKRKDFGIQIIPQCDPDTNIVTYCICFPGVIEDPELLNILMDAVFENMTKRLVQRTSSYDYFISKTSLNYSSYKTHLTQLLKNASIEEKIIDDWGKGSNAEITILRSVFMNPLAVGLPQDYYNQFWEKVESICEEEGLERVLQKLVKDKNENRRIKVLWIENQKNVEELKHEIERDILGRYFSFEFVHSMGEIENLAEESVSQHNDVRIAITDLCLDGDHRSRPNVNKAVKIINNLYEMDNNIICYSKYLKDEETNSVASGIVNDLKNLHTDFNENRLFFIGKNVDFKKLENIEFLSEKEKKETLQALNSDIRLIFKNLILTLQRL